MSILSKIKEIGTKTYFLAFTLLFSVVYSVGTLLFLNRVENCAKITLIVAIVAFLFFNYVSILYFGRQYRKHYSKHKLELWPFLCFDLLFLADLFFLAEMYELSFYTLYTRMFFVYSITVVNMAVPFILVPLPISFRSGIGGGIQFICSSIAWLVGVTVVFVMVLGSMANINNVVIEFAEQYPAKLLAFNNNMPLWLSTVVFSFSVLLLVLWYISHAKMVSCINNIQLSSLFTTFVNWSIAVPLVLYIFSICYTVKSSKSFIKAISNPEEQYQSDMSVSALESFYLNNEKIDMSFWEDVSSCVSGYNDALNQNCKFLNELCKNSMPRYLDGMSDGVLPPDLNWNDLEKEIESVKKISEKVDSILEKVSIIPKYNRDFVGVSNDLFEDQLMINVLEKFYNIRILSSIHNKKSDEAMKIWKLKSKLDAALLDDISIFSDVLRRSNQDTVIISMLNSNIFSDNQLTELLDEYANAEPKIIRIYSLLQFYSLVLFVDSFDKNQKLSCVRGNDKNILCLSIRSTSIFMPQLYISNINNAINKISDSEVKKMSVYYCNASIAKNRIISTALASEIFFRRKGRYPREIQELYPDILQNIPKNPFSDKDISMIADGDNITYKCNDVGIVINIKNRQ